MDAGVDHAAAGGHRSMHDEWYIVGRLRDWAPPNPILELWRRAVCGEPGERFKAGEGPHSIVLSFPRFGLSLSLARSVRARSGVVVSGRWSPLRLGAIQSHHSYRMMPPLSGPGLEPVLRQPLGDLDDARAVWDRRALRRPAVPRLGAAATVVPARQRHLAGLLAAGLAGVRQLRPHFGPALTHSQSPTRGVRHALCGVHAYGMLIEPML